MAIGQVLNIPSGQNTLITTNSHDERSSVAILNPNDGVVYLALNRKTSNQIADWDWKLPSQSYGIFPGPWTSLGIFYLDQSGANRAGDLNIYESNNKLDIPIINSIGRALQATGTALDITEGVQPANPAAGNLRLWADANGVLHGLESTGHDESLIDTDTVLGGALAGTLPNPSFASPLILPNGNIQASNGIVSAGIANGSSVAGDLNTHRIGADTGAIFFGSNPHYIYYDGANWALSPALNASQLIDASITTQKLAYSAVFETVGQASLSSDIWNSVALGSGDNSLSYSCSFTIRNTSDLVFAYISGCFLMSPPMGANTTVGWVPYVDNAGTPNAYQTPLNAVLAPNSGPGVYCSVGSFVYLGNGYTVGTHSFTPRVRNAVATSSGAYLRAGTTASEWLNSTIFIVKR